jgi:hypothetical protein
MREMISIQQILELKFGKYPGYDIRFARFPFSDRLDIDFSNESDVAKHLKDVELEFRDLMARYFFFPESLVVKSKQAESGERYLEVRMSQTDYENFKTAKENIKRAIDENKLIAPKDMTYSLYFTQIMVQGIPVLVHAVPQEYEGTAMELAQKLRRSFKNSLRAQDEHCEQDKRKISSMKQRHVFHYAFGPWGRVVATTCSAEIISKYMTQLYEFHHCSPCEKKQKYNDLIIGGFSFDENQLELLGITDRYRLLRMGDSFFKYNQKLERYEYKPEKEVDAQRFYMMSFVRSATGEALKLGVIKEAGLIYCSEREHQIWLDAIQKAREKHCNFDTDSFNFIEFSKYGENFFLVLSQGEVNYSRFIKDAPWLIRRGRVGDSIIPSKLVVRAVFQNQEVLFVKPENMQTIFKILSARSNFPPRKILLDEKHGDRSKLEDLMRAGMQVPLEIKEGDLVKISAALSIFSNRRGMVLNALRYSLYLKARDHYNQDFLAESYKYLELDGNYIRSFLAADISLIIKKIILHYGDRSLKVLYDQIISIINSNRIKVNVKSELRAKSIIFYAETAWESGKDAKGGERSVKNTLISIVKTKEGFVCEINKGAKQSNVAGRNTCAMELLCALSNLFLQHQLAKSHAEAMPEQDDSAPMDIDDAPEVDGSQSMDECDDVDVSEDEDGTSAAPPESKPEPRTRRSAGRLPPETATAILLREAPQIAIDALRYDPHLYIADSCILGAGKGLFLCGNGETLPAGTILTWYGGRVTYKDYIDSSIDLTTVAAMGTTSASAHGKIIYFSNKDPLDHGVAYYANCERVSPNCIVKVVKGEAGRVLVLKESVTVPKGQFLELVYNYGSSAQAIHKIPKDAPSPATLIVRELTGVIVRERVQPALPKPRVEQPLVVRHKAASHVSQFATTTPNLFYRPGPSGVRKRAAADYPESVPPPKRT